MYTATKKPPITLLVLAATLFLVSTLLGQQADHGQMLRFVIEQDKTGSANHNFTPQMTPADLRKLVELVRQRGGDIAVGLVHERANRSLVRLHLDPPPSYPALPEPSDAEPVLARNRHWASYRLEKASRENQERSRKQQQEPSIEEFLRAANSILSEPVDGKCTDLWGALDRAATFLNEPLGSGRAPYSLALLISDAEHTCGRKQVPKMPGHLVMVNGNPGMGSLAGTALVIDRFENVSAAVRYVEKEVTSR